MSNTVSIVFIHGLLGDPRATWEKKIPSENIAPLANEYPQKRRRISLFGHRESHNHDKQPELGAALTTEIRGDTSNNPKSIFWPEQLLPTDIPNAKIFTYGYNTNVVGGLFRGPDMNNVSQHANDLLINLKSELRNKKPIIFVAHSMGGILVKDVSIQIPPYRPYANGSLDVATLQD